MMKNYPQSRQNDIVIKELANETLIYNLKTNKAYCLNETSTLVWQTCDGNKSVSEICRQVNEKLKLPATDEFVFYALEQLKKEDLLVHNEQTPDSLKGLSRREVVRRIGLGSMVALPIISSLVAPTAASAQSGGAGLNQPCTGGIDVQGSCAAGFLCCADILPSNPNTCQPDTGAGACDVV